MANKKHRKRKKKTTRKISSGPKSREPLGTFFLFSIKESPGKVTRFTTDITTRTDLLLATFMTFLKWNLSDSEASISGCLKVKCRARMRTLLDTLELEGFDVQICTKTQFAANAMHECNENETTAVFQSEEGSSTGTDLTARHQRQLRVDAYMARLREARTDTDVNRIVVEGFKRRYDDFGVLKNCLTALKIEKRVAADEALTAWAEGLTLRNWQKKLAAMIEEENDTKIFVVCDTRGGEGKTTFVSYYIGKHGNSLSVHSKESSSSVDYLMSRSDYDWKAVFLDIPRCADITKDTVQIMEGAKSGRYGTSKYAGTDSKRQKKKPAVVMFCNEITKIDFWKLTMSRWIVLKLHRETQSSPVTMTRLSPVERSPCISTERLLMQLEKHNVSGCSASLGLVSQMQFYRYCVYDKYGRVDRRIDPDDDDSTVFESTSEGLGFHQILPVWEEETIDLEQDSSEVTVQAQNPTTTTT